MPGNLKRADLENFIRDAATTYSHETCTAKRSRDSMSVVDGRLKVYGIDNLRIADGSIMPARRDNRNTDAPCVVSANVPRDPAAEAGLYPHVRRGILVCGILGCDSFDRRPYPSVFPVCARCGADSGSPSRTNPIYTASSKGAYAAASLKVASGNSHPAKGILALAISGVN